MRSSWLYYLLLILCGGAAGRSPAQEPHAPPQEKLPVLLASPPAKEDRADDELRKLLKARYNAALAEAKHHYEYERIGRDRAYDQDDQYGRWRRLVRAGLALCGGPAERAALLARYVDLTRQVEQLEQARHAAGRIHDYILHRARYERLDAEVRLHRAKAEADKAKAK
jgi:hypothetical protein